MSNILVTGANGFVGRCLSELLHKKGYKVRGAVRDMNEYGVDHIKKILDDVICVGSIDAGTDWDKALNGIDVVIHLAARVHILQEVSSNPLEAFRSVNVRGTERLANEAIRSGIKRFIYISSIAVHGNSTSDDHPYVEDDPANPIDSYAISKWESEKVIKDIAASSNMALVVIRPPLVYGPGVGGNFFRLMQWAGKAWPLPLGCVRNKRSFIAIENLADAILCCVEHPKADGETFLVSDGHDVSTPDLLRQIADLMERPARIFPFPVPMLRTAGSLFGMTNVVDRLCNSLQVNCGKAQALLGWRPRMSFDKGLSETVKWYVDEKQL